MLSSPIEEIKSRLDIVDVVGSYIKLQKAGVNYRAVCPFHNEKKPSFFVSPGRQIWHCFGACGFGGDIFKFVMQIEGVEFGDALRILAQKAGVELKKEDIKVKTERQRLYEISELACRFFEKQLDSSLAGKEAKKYILSRGIKEETIKTWRLGYAPDSWQGLSDFLVSQGYKREEIEKAGLALSSQKSSHYDRFRARVIFPIFDLSHQVVGFGARIFKESKRDDGTEEAKYINSPATLLYDKSRILYSLNKAGIEIRKKNACVLVEGYTDAVLAHQAGFTNVVATSGTALTEYQLKILKRYSENLLTAFDMDIAGNSATKRGIDLAQSLGFNIKVVAMPENSDPADVISSDSSAWQGLVDKAKTIHDFYFDTVFSRFDKDTLDGKKEISKFLLPIIKRIPNRIERTFWIQSLSNKLGVKEDDIAEELSKIKGEYFEVYSDKPVSSLPNKTRRDLLEEHLIILIMKLPDNLELLQEEDFALFSPRIFEIVRHFKEKGLVSFPDEHKEMLDTLFLRSEIEEIDSDIKEEFNNCLKEIRTLVIKDKLDRICKEIKMAEVEKDFERVNQLTQEFNNFSKSRCDLEIS